MFLNDKALPSVIASNKLIPSSLLLLIKSSIVLLPIPRFGNKTIEEIITKSNEEGISIFDAITEGKALIFKNLII